MITDADALSAPPVMSTPRQRLKGAKKPGSCSRCGCVERLVWRWTVAGERGEGAGVAACVCERETECVCVCVCGRMSWFKGLIVFSWRLVLQMAKQPRH
jgi:hypothetical protein